MTPAIIQHHSLLENPIIEQAYKHFHLSAREAGIHYTDLAWEYYTSHVCATVTLPDYHESDKPKKQRRNQLNRWKKRFPRLQNSYSTNLEEGLASYFSHFASSIDHWRGFVESELQQLLRNVVIISSKKYEEATNIEVEKTPSLLDQAMTSHVEKIVQTETKIDTIFQYLLEPVLEEKERIKNLVSLYRPTEVWQEKLFLVSYPPIYAWKENFLQKDKEGTLRKALQCCSEAHNTAVKQFYNSLEDIDKVIITRGEKVFNCHGAAYRGYMNKAKQERLTENNGGTS